jgi:hypothetical protein
LPPFQGLAGEVEELVNLLSQSLLTEQVHFESKIDFVRQLCCDVIRLPLCTVGKKYPLNTLVQGISLCLTEMFGGKLGGDTLTFDECDKFLVDADAVVSELTFDLVLGG